MKKFLTFLAISILYFTNSTIAQEKMRIIVMDLKPIGLSLVEGKATSRLLESDIVDSKLFVVVERNQITAILKEQGFQQTGCTDSACAVEVGKLLSANKILMGDVSKLGKMIMMTVKIVDVEKGISEFSVNQKAKSMAVIDEAINELVKKLIARLGGEDSGRFATRIGTPKDFTVTDGNYKEKIVIKWKKVKGADKYYVFRSTSRNGEYKMIHSAKETSLVDTKTEEGSGYYYKVRAGLYSKAGKFTEPVQGSRGRSSTSYYMRGIIPGWSQFYYNHNLKGGLFLGSFLAASALIGYTSSRWNLAKKDYNGLKAGTPQSQIDSTFNKYDKAGQNLSLSIGLFAAIYVAHWVDVMFFNGPIYDNAVSSTELKGASISFDVFNSQDFNNETRVNFGIRFKI